VIPELTEEITARLFRREMDSGVVCSDTTGHAFAWYVECFWCKHCGCVKADVASCAPGEHSFVWCVVSRRSYCTRCARCDNLRSTNLLEIGGWDVLFPVLTHPLHRRRFLFALACLCKHPPAIIISYVEQQKYLYVISQPIQCTEIPLNCGFTRLTAFRNADTSVSISGAAHVLDGGMSSVCLAYNDLRDSQIIFGINLGKPLVPRVSCSDLSRSGDYFAIWYPDVVSLMEIVLVRMVKHGKINLQIAKDLVMNTIVHLVAQMKKDEFQHRPPTWISAKFLETYCMTNLMIRAERSGNPLPSATLLDIARIIDVMGCVGILRCDIETCTSNIADTITYTPYDAYLKPTDYIDRK